MLISLPQQWRHQQAFIKFIFVTRSPQSQRSIGRSIVLESYPQIFACVLKNWGGGGGCKKSVRNPQCIFPSVFFLHFYRHFNFSSICYCKRQIIFLSFLLIYLVIKLLHIIPLMSKCCGSPTHTTYT